MDAVPLLLAAVPGFGVGHLMVGRPVGFAVFAGLDALGWSGVAYAASSGRVPTGAAVAAVLLLKVIQLIELDAQGLPIQPPAAPSTPAQPPNAILDSSATAMSIQLTF